MTGDFRWLTDAEMDAILAKPQVTYTERWGPADEWYAANKPRLERESPGKHLILNASDLTHVIVAKHIPIRGDKKGSDYYYYRAYTSKYGPTPKNGRPMYYTDIPDSMPRT